jgi:hypothetical protein
MRGASGGRSAVCGQKESNARCALADVLKERRAAALLLTTRYPRVTTRFLDHPLG